MSVASPEVVVVVAAPEPKTAVASNVSEEGLERKPAADDEQEVGDPSGNGNNAMNVRVPEVHVEPSTPTSTVVNMSMAASASSAQLKGGNSNGNNRTGVSEKEQQQQHEKTTSTPTRRGANKTNMKGVGTRRDVGASLVFLVLNMF